MPDGRTDIAVIGSGPNGLAAAILLQAAGLEVTVYERADAAGGGVRSAELIMPGFIHDVCSAVHPLGADSPFFNGLPLERHGLEWVRPEVAYAHPLDDGTAPCAFQSIERTAADLGPDGEAWQKLFGPYVRRWPSLAADILSPLRIPSSPFLMARFGLAGLRSAAGLAKARFDGERARALFSGVAAHSMLPLTKTASAAPGIVLGILAHVNGWPFPRGGASSLAASLTSFFESLGGRIELGREITDVDELPPDAIKIFDVTPRQLLRIAGHRLSRLYRWQLGRYRYGPGVFKVDWVLKQPIPFKAEAARRAGTVHLGGTFAEIAASEAANHEGRIAERPFVLLAQQSVFDETRTPDDRHVAWAYCHVPNGSTVDMTHVIETQVERFAPGFRDVIEARHTMNSAEIERYNPNYVGGDVNGGVQDLGQLFTRPVLRLSPYATSHPRIFLCSSSTPPGGGVHGMSGYHAARTVLRRRFKVNPPQAGLLESGAVER